MGWPSLSVHKLTATASQITATATKYGLNITDEGGKVELLEGTVLEVKDSGTSLTTALRLPTCKRAPPWWSTRPRRCL